MKEGLKGQADVATPKRTKEIVQKYGFTFKKSLGQNFLTDQNILRKIVSAADLKPECGVLEIGPGIGALTQFLAREAGRVVAVEIDERLIPILNDTLIEAGDVRIVHGDVLKLSLPELFAEHFSDIPHVSVVANLPYYVTTPIIMKFLEERLPLDNIVVMIQKEVADRMTAKPGGKEYGSLSVAVQYYCEPEIVAIVPNTVFIPQPGVDSAVIKLKVRRQPAVETVDDGFFFEVVQACFAQRRKTIANNLLGRYFAEGGRPALELTLQSCGIDPSRRGETLTMAEFAALTEVIFQRTKRSIL